jgi:hypothetical protein
MCGPSGVVPQELFTTRGIKNVFHYAPLHYLLFITRAGALFSKVELAGQGYDVGHFRRTSRRQDELRGFAEYVHLTLNALPPILRAKLTAGFPHFEVGIPAEAIAASEVHLCRYNIAKCRYLRRDGKSGPEESSTNGRYYGEKQLPIAATPADCATLLDTHYPGTMIEVLIPNRLDLPSDTTLLFFREEDLELARDVLAAAGLAWDCALSDKHHYIARESYGVLVREFLTRSLRDATWKGDGLEFDSV